MTTGSDGDDDDDDEDQPVLDTINVIHDGGVNRIRVCNSKPVQVTALLTNGNDIISDIMILLVISTKDESHTNYVNTIGGTTS